ncbi:inner membrane protein OXA1-like protein [Actinidia rufa]|uniref:Inner membrane protein OXA1-like protein n=1 Tax=Actinidia rufa TaxID=165716 RepID=A0A7J0FTK5_9ERIC|nr:inner membrane protein OXA1-like protein [Actinidia rufa]
MAYRRSISARATLFARQRFSPSLSYIHRDDGRKHNEDRSISTFGSEINTSSGFGSSSYGQRSSQFFASSMTGSFFGRHMSTMVGEGAEKIEYMTDVAEVLADRTAEAVASAAPVVNEVAIAAADSAFPVAALQHLIDGVHSLTGFNWWASIVVTTLLIRGATVPLLINQLKSTTKLSLLRPHLEEIKQEMQDKGMDPKAVAEGQQRMQALFKEYGVTPFTPLKGLLFQGPVFISFFLACNMQEGMEGNPAAKTMKNISRVFAAVTVPVTMSFPKALFCYWVTSNLFSLTYGLVLKAPGVKKFLGVPEITVAPPASTSEKPSLPFLETLKKFAAAQQAASSPVEPSKPAADQRIPSSSVISQRLRSLEKQVKGRKKNKKR